MKNRAYLILFIIVLACNRPDVMPAKESKIDTLAASREHYIGTGKLIPINFNDTNYVEVGLFAKDTLTKGGWQINYLVKDDSTRYKDVYIQWSKGDKKWQYKAESVLTFRRYFIPEYEGENSAGLFFTCACATDCQAVLVLSKDSKGGFNKYNDVAAYDIPFGQVLFLTENTQHNGDHLFELALADVIRNKEHKILYKGIARVLPRTGAVQDVQFFKNKAVITTRLFRSQADSVEQNEVRTINLK